MHFMFEVLLLLNGGRQETRDSAIFCIVGGKEEEEVGSPRD